MGNWKCLAVKTRLIKAKANSENEACRNFQTFLLFAQLLVLNNVKVSREARKQKEANLI